MEGSYINVEKQTTLEAPEMLRISFSKLFEFFQGEILCDVVIQAGKKSVKCHRAVMASFSPYFEAMFTTSLKEKDQPVITIHDIDENALEIVIKFAYTAKIDLSTENAQSVLLASNFLQVEPLAQLCCVFISSHLDVTNCLGIRDLAQRFGHDDLVKKADIFIQNNFLAISKQEEFVSIDAKQLEDILSDDDLFVESETEVCMALLRWIKHDTQNRSDVFLKLLSHIRLPFLPLELIRSIEDEPFTCSNIGCQVLLNAAKNFPVDPMTCSCTWLLTNNKIGRPRKSYAGAIFNIGGGKIKELSSNELFSLYHNKWIKVQDMTSERLVFKCTSTEGKVYAVGGFDHGRLVSSTEVYDPKTNQWSVLTPMPTPKSELGVCVAGGAIYAIGGDETGGESCVVERYDILSNVWSTVSPMNCKRRHISVVELNGIVYAMGGFGVRNEVLNTCEAYNAQLDKWLPLPPMNVARSGAAAVVLNGYIYVIGGTGDSEDLEDFIDLSSVEKYDLKKMQWTFVSPMTEERRYAGAAVLGGCIYVIGGFNDKKDGHLNTVEIYDPENDVWTFGPQTHDRIAKAGVTWCNIGANDLKNLFDLASED